MNTTHTPLTTPASAEANCPSCQRFVGPHDRCPYCGAEMHQRMSLRVFRIGAIVVAVVGIACLHLMALHRDIPLRRIEEVTPQMNFGYIAIEGVARMPMRYYTQGDRVTGSTLVIDDGTGEMRVQAYTHVAAALKDSGVIVRTGDRVKASGVVRVIGDDSIRLLLQAPDHVVVQDAADTHTVALDELAHRKDGENIRLQATIERIQRPFAERAPYSIYLKDGTGNAQVVLWESQFEDLHADEQLLPGTLVDVRGIVTFFRGNPQIRLEHTEDFIILAHATATDAMPMGDAPETDRGTSRSLADITQNDIGSRITVEATVASLRTPPDDSRAPYTLTVTDGTRTLPIVFWDATHTHITDKRSLNAQAQIRATVTVASYRNDIQLRLNNANDLMYLGMAEEPVSAPRPRERERTVSPTPATDRIYTVAEAASLSEGRRVTITGEVIDIRSPRPESRTPYRVILADTPEPREMIIWPDTFSALPLDSRPRRGCIITANVTIGSFRNQVQFQLVDAESLTITGEAVDAPVPVTPTPPSVSPTTEEETMSPQDAAALPVGRVVIIHGTVERTTHPREGTRVPHRFTFYTSTGTSIDMICWPNVYERVPADKRIGQGDTVTVRVSVDSFRNEPQFTLRNAQDILSVHRTDAPTDTTRVSPAEALQEQRTFRPSEAIEQPDGERITVSGTIARVVPAPEGSRAPHRIYLSGDVRDALMVCWDNVFNALVDENKTPQPGAVIRAVVTVETYRETKQLQLRNARDFHLVSPPPTTPQ